MTRTGNSRLAGITFLLYIATGIGSMIILIAGEKHGAPLATEVRSSKFEVRSKRKK